MALLPLLAGGAIARETGTRLSLAPPPQQQASGAHNAQKVTTLESGKHVALELSGGQKHPYHLPLTAGPICDGDGRAEGY